jgi:hypothetical protein
MLCNLADKGTIQKVYTVLAKFIYIRGLTLIKKGEFMRNGSKKTATSIKERRLNLILEVLAVWAILAMAAVGAYYLEPNITAFTILNNENPDVNFINSGEIINIRNFAGILALALVVSVVFLINRFFFLSRKQKEESKISKNGNSKKSKRHELLNIKNENGEIKALEREISGLNNVFAPSRKIKPGFLGKIFGKGNLDPERGKNQFPEIHNDADAEKIHNPGKILKNGFISKLVYRKEEKKPVEKTGIILRGKSREFAKCIKLILKTNESLGKKDSVQAKKIYIKARKAYTKLEYNEKREAYNKLLAAYKKLSDHMVQ